MARGPANLSLDDSKFCLNTLPPTQEDFDEIMCQANCFVCWLAKTHENIYFISLCKKLKKYGYTMKYDWDTNGTCKNLKKSGTT